MRPVSRDRRLGPQPARELGVRTGSRWSHGRTRLGLHHEAAEGAGAVPSLRNGTAECGDERIAVVERVIRRRLIPGRLEEARREVRAVEKILVLPAVAEER